jgi:hypothetical protein
VLKQKLPSYHEFILLFVKAKDSSLGKNSLTSKRSGTTDQKIQMILFFKHNTAFGLQEIIFKRSNISKNVDP